MLKQKYSRQKEETNEMIKRREKLEEQMAKVHSTLQLLITGNIDIFMLYLAGIFLDCKLTCCTPSPERLKISYCMYRAIPER